MKTKRKKILIISKIKDPLKTFKLHIIRTGSKTNQLNVSNVGKKLKYSSRSIKTC